jgi:mono/diheme cytochrome c family protein
VAGAALFAANCSGCHGPDPRANNMNVQFGSTVAGLEAAFQAVFPMNRFQTALSATDKANLSAYIASRK